MNNANLYSARILIADDDSLSLVELKQVLVNAGYKNILSVNDTKSSLKECIDKKPDLIFLRLSMQCSEGEAMLDDLKSCYEQSAFPIIVLADQNDLKTRLMAHKWGVREFLGQPYNPSEVIFRARYVLNNS